jgi:putative ABC transport system permease protein
MGAVDRSLAREGHDVEVLLQRPAPSATLEAVAAKVSGVSRAEAWRRASVSISTSASPTGAEVESSRFAFSGYPAGSRLFTLPVVAGRAPAQDARGEALASWALQEIYPAIAAGKTVEVKFRERRVPLTIVGLVEQIGAPAMYAPFNAYDAVAALGDSALSLRVKGSGADVDELANRLDQAFLDARHAPSQVISRNLVRDSLDEHFDVVGGVMRVVALAAALIGAIVLVGTAAFNVAERRREVGVLRALGATPGRIRSVFLVEGGAIARSERSCASKSRCSFRSKASRSSPSACSW